MIMRKTMMALAATAALATGTVAATSSAEAKVVIKVQGGHHGHHGHHFYGGPYYGGPYYGGYYGGGCVVKPKLVYTPWGPVWKNKTFCY